MNDALPEGIGIRNLRTQPEFEACVRLQYATWGEGFGESVPAAILRVASRYGGVIAAAFDVRGPDAPEEAEMVGFVFGLTGPDGDRLVHWSDMLAVLPAWRGRGVGTALKAWQRARLLELGVREMRWSFDPLEAANASLNLARLGAVGRWYEEDMYGVPSSPLHAGIGTDRLVVSWALEEDEPPVASVRNAEPVRTAEAARNAELARDPSVVRVPIPRNVQELKARDPEEARRWRIRVRNALAPVLADGGEVRGFEDPGVPEPPVLLVVPRADTSHPPPGENPRAPAGNLVKGSRT